MKRKSIDLRTLWERKAQKVASTSTPTPQLVTDESEAQNHVPLAQAVTIESQVVQNRSTKHETTANEEVTQPEKRDQDIVNAVELILLTKFQLQALREDVGWEDFLQEVDSFCVKHQIEIPNMNSFYRPVGRDKRFFIKIKNRHRFHVEMFLSVIDRQLHELNERFDEVNTDLLLCMAAFNPTDNFANWDKDKLVKLAQFYPNDFSSSEIGHIPYALRLFLTDVRRDERFRKVKSLAELSVMLVETKMHTRHEVVYRLLKLVLVLPVATASVERIFSAMNYVKNKLRNKMGDQYLNEFLVTFIEREFFLLVKECDIINRFQAMKERKVKTTLPSSDASKT